MLIFWVHISFLVTTREGLHALMLKKVIRFLIQPCCFQDFCLCLRGSVLASAPPLRAYSALIGQFNYTFSKWTYREAQHTVTHLWSEIWKNLMRTERSEPLETAHSVYCYTPWPHYFILWHHLKQHSDLITSFIGWFPALFLRRCLLLCLCCVGFCYALRLVLDTN